MIQKLEKVLYTFCTLISLKVAIEVFSSKSTWVTFLGKLSYGSLYVFTVTYLLQVFFLIYLFVTATAALPIIVLKKPPGLGGETSIVQVVIYNQGKLKFGRNIEADEGLMRT